MKKPKIILNSILISSLLSSGAGLYLTDAPVVAAANSALTISNTILVEPTHELKPLWKDKASGMGLYDKVAPISNGLFYYSSGDALKAVDIATGKVIWSYKKGTHPEIVTNNSVFFITYDGYLVKVVASTGKLIWKVKVAKGPIEIGAFAELHNGVLYFRNEHGGIATYNPVSGKKIWENPTIPMYAGSIIGQCGEVFVVSSTVDNLHTQFFGLDPTTGKQLWRIQGLYHFVAYREGQLIFREQAEAIYQSTNTAPIPGYQMTLSYVDVTTGKMVNQENYKLLDDISRLGNAQTLLQGSYIFSVDGNLDKNEDFLSRFVLGDNPETEPKSYEEYGDWLAGPVNGVSFFQKGSQITSVNVYNDKIMNYDGLNRPVVNIQHIGKGIYTGYDNGYLYIMNAETGATIGKVKSEAQQYGKIFIQNGTLLIQTEHNVFAITLPKELK